jgi:hypothetical protein
MVEQSNSSTPRRASATSGSAVCTIMPALTGVLQEICSFGMPSTRTWHSRHEPSIDSLG